MNRTFAFLSCFGWLLFIVIDYYWNHIISEAVELKQGAYGEIFGPISFFRPIVLYSSFILSILTCILSMTDKKIKVIKLSMKKKNKA